MIHENAIVVKGVIVSISEILHGSIMHHRLGHLTYEHSFDAS